MNLLRKIRLFPLLVFFFSLAFSASVTSCGQKQADTTEESEHPAATDEAEKDEHPQGADEHPTEKADSTQTEQQQ